MQVLTPQRGTSWPSLIADIVLIGKEHARPFPLDKESSIRPAISTRVKLNYPDRVYVANKEERDGLLAIWVYRES
ncbi:hypothetical protein SAMN05421821_105183 [Mucilaginibacter lappiensis]|uniref:Uncharacterized protein n=1 Tax=Mucilaginibacter lappiensis TaxID=354630 RepID=A0ABR6PJ55_9SPHI|nr:hypothetical protein [Mucilaginibacter lappiensis]SIR14790.1 hypothetical protein SAMN05421821_105183 [Mucilaginibacter lappiensis]